MLAIIPHGLENKYFLRVAMQTLHDAVAGLMFIERRKHGFHHLNSVKKSLFFG
jgi:hypothetical protein